jgi:hypothetical protein
LNVPLGAVKIASGGRSRLKRVESQRAKADQLRAMAPFSAARKLMGDVSRSERAPAIEK